MNGKRSSGGVWTTAKKRYAHTTNGCSSSRPTRTMKEWRENKERKKERMTSLPTKVSRTTLPIYADFHSPRPFCFFQSIEEKKKTSSTYCICPTYFLRLDFLRRIRFIPPAEAKWMMRRQFGKSQIATTPFPWQWKKTSRFGEELHQSE